MDEGRQRRSARLSALDKCKQEKAPCGGVPKVEKRAEDGKETGRGQGLPGKKRGRKKKKLEEVEEVVVNSVDKVVGEGGQNLQQDGHLRNSASSSASCVPDKRVLELILDVLQRKDTHEIFAEPVDPDEVEGYYDIIKDPMDFGTMRAKLQEGLYTSLEQFENDILLICSNAMVFNSPSTVFYRQARSIQELAKKAFLALRTDPENFESEFSSTRRRHYLNKAMKSHVDETSQADAGNSDSHPKPATSVKSINLASHITSIDRQRPSQGHLGLKRNLHERPMASGSTALVENRRTGEDLFGFRDGRKSNVVEEERRSYRPWADFLSSNESLVSTLADGPRQLSYANLDNSSYTASLQRFVKDLGPTAQMVAQRKLEKSQNRGWDLQAPGWNFWTPALPPETPGQNFQTQAKLPVQPTRVPSNNVVIFPASRINVDNKSYHPNANVDTANRNDILSTATGEMFHQNQGSDIPSCTYLPSGFGSSGVPAAFNRDSRNELLATMPSSGLPGNPTQSVDLTLEFSQSRLLEIMLKNNNSVVTPPRPFQVMNASGSSQSVIPMHNSCFRASDEDNQVAASSSWPFHAMKASGSGQAGNSMRNSFPTSNEENQGVLSPSWPFHFMKASGTGQVANSMHYSSIPTSDDKNQAAVSHSWPFHSMKASGSGQAANSMHNSSFPTSDEDKEAAVSHSWPFQPLKSCSSGQVANSMHDSCFPASDEENQAGASPSWPFQAKKAFGSGQASNSMNKSRFQTSDGENRIASSPSWPFHAMKASGSDQGVKSMFNSGFPTSNEKNQAVVSHSWPFQAMKASDSGEAANPIHISGLHTSDIENQAAASSFSPFSAMKPSGSGQAADSIHNPCVHTFDGKNQAAVEAPDLSGRNDSSQMDQCSPWGRPELWGPQTVLDMSYLQARLGGANSWGQNGISRPELPPAHVSETVFVDDSERNVGHSLQGELSTRMLFDTHPDLALQL
eukprot:TRINITY_DN10132_c0_g1_i2.p1 TRINITY_DN10132_c0_g1~~TRINITY_DN10132_c0_g1_i2.p1  ORF type:complete len:968 (+),score=214.58 TRINITY_DN10132_c0_g1_i2:757-3660(+)